MLHGSMIDTEEGEVNKDSSINRLREGKAGDGQRCCWHIVDEEFYLLHTFTTARF